LMVAFFTWLINWRTWVSNQRRWQHVLRDDLPPPYEIHARY
jgi:hypothetical protein